MKITVDRISLRNFKGIKALDVELGSSTSIYGRNATGKTTVFDAFLWTLFGKDSMNSATFEIKNLDSAGNPAHNLEHSVEIALTAGSRPVTLKKVYQEKYTRKRGSAASEFTGHTTEYFIDGVPLKEKEYAERVGGIVDERVFRLLTDPRYFNEVLHWQEKRKILMEVCGDVSVQDVIASDSALAGLEAVLNGHGIEDAKKIIAAQKAKINDELKKIPVRIDEATRSMSEIRSDIDTVPGQIEFLQGGKEELERQLSDIKNGGALSRKRIELQEVEAEIRAQKNAFEEGKSARIAPLGKELETIQDTGRTIGNRRKDLISNISRAQNANASLEKELSSLRSLWTDTDARDCTDPTTCPTCGQALPEIQVNEAREKFNKAKAEKLAGIDERGKTVKATLEANNAEIEEMTRELNALVDPGLEAAEAEIEKKISAIRAERPDLSGLEEKKASIQAEINNISGAEQGLVSEIQAKLFHVKAEIGNLQGDLLKVESNKTARTRIEELGAQEKELSKKFEELEANLFLCENFTRAKVALLDERINSKFSLARFRLFADQINGGLQEVCETTLGGVPYNSINNAGRIQVGMDIIRTLQAHYGIQGPIFIDNRESIVDLPEMDCQTVSLIVSEQDKALRIETGDEPMKKAGGM